MRVQFTASKDEFRYIRLIADRAMSAGLYPEGETLQDALIDIEATHSNGCPLDLSALANATPGNFGHDVGGIRKHLDRTTGRLMNNFVPRHAKKEKI